MDQYAEESTKGKSPATAKVAAAGGMFYGRMHRKYLEEQMWRRVTQTRKQTVTLLFRKKEKWKRLCGRQNVSAISFLEQTPYNT